MLPHFSLGQYKLGRERSYLCGNSLTPDGESVRGFRLVAEFERAVDDFPERMEICMTEGKRRYAVLELSRRLEVLVFGPFRATRSPFIPWGEGDFRGIFKEFGLRFSHQERYSSTQTKLFFSFGRYSRRGLFKGIGQCRLKNV